MELDPELVAQMGARAKVALRQRMKALRAAHPGPALAERSAKIAARVAELPAFAAARSVALFWPMLEQKEVDLRALDRAARSAHKSVFYPGFRRSPEGTLFTDLRLTASVDELVVRGQRFAEPPPDAPAASRDDIDLLVVPALAAALSGHRLGYGRGFYDSLLPDFRPPALAVIVAFDFQLLAELPIEPHDVACDVVISESRTTLIAPKSVDT